MHNFHSYYVSQDLKMLNIPNYWSVKAHQNKARSELRPFKRNYFSFWHKSNISYLNSIHLLIVYRILIVICYVIITLCSYHRCSLSHCHQNFIFHALSCVLMKYVILILKYQRPKCHFMTFFPTVTISHPETTVKKEERKRSCSKNKGTKQKICWT